MILAIVIMMIMIILLKLGAIVLVSWIFFYTTLHKEIVLNQ
jgi:hypothetical protein